MTHQIKILFAIIALPFLSTAQITWQNTSYNEPARVNKLYCANNDSVFALSNGSGLFCSANNGNNWNDMNTGITTSNLFCMLKASDGKYFVGSTGYTFFSSPEAINWTQGVMTGTGTAISDFDDPLTGVLYAGQIADGIFRSYDNGATWIEFGFCCDGVRCVYHSGDSILYAGTNAKGLYHSSNAGATWKTINTGLKSKRINDVIFCNNQFYCATDSGLFSSDNFGAQWNSISAMENKKIICLYADKHDNLFAGSETYGLYVLRKGFSYWTQENGGLSSLNILSICSDSSNTIYVSTGDSSVYRSSEIFNTIEENGSSNTININCFPNPAVDQITISFKQLSQSLVSIDIVTLDGKICTEIFSGNLDAGSYEYLWKPEYAGTFFLRITSNNFNYSKAFTIVN